MENVGPRCGACSVALERRVAEVAASRLDRLVSVHRHRLRRADLEECLSQAMIELVLAVRRGRQFAGDAHIEHAFEQRFLSRVIDQQRAAAGRSPARAGQERAVRIDAQPASARDAIVGSSPTPEAIVVAREHVLEITRRALLLSEDERTVFASRIGLLGDASEVCEARGWTREKYRKLAQRGRNRLERLERESAGSTGLVDGPQ